MDLKIVFFLSFVEKSDMILFTCAEQIPEW